MRIQSLNTINYNQARKQNDSQPVKEENNNLSFKGGMWDAIGKFYGANYAEKMLNQKWLHSVSHKLAGASNLMTQLKHERNISVFWMSIINNFIINKNFA